MIMRLHLTNRTTKFVTKACSMYLILPNTKYDIVATTYILYIRHAGSSNFHTKIAADPFRNSNHLRWVQTASRKRLVACQPFRNVSASNAHHTRLVLNEP